MAAVRLEQPACRDARRVRWQRVRRARPVSRMGRLITALSCLLVGMVALFFCIEALLAKTSTDQHADSVAVRVGPTQIRLSELQTRLGEMPSFQVRSLGTTSEEILHAIVDRSVVPDALLALEARRQKLSQRPDVAVRLREVLRAALVDEIKREVARDTPVTGDDIRSYVSAHRAEFETPQRLRLWWIVVSDEALATRIAQQARGASGPKRWSELARKHSRDRSTRFRQGDLGFVEPSGQTSLPHLRVPPELYQAADRLADGEISPEPVRVRDGFAVVWRRGVTPAVAVNIDSIREGVEQAVLEERVGHRLDQLLSDLRKRYVADLHPELTKQLSRPSGRPH